MDWVAAILGIVGGLLIAYKMKSGFIIWMMSNFVWIYIGVSLSKWGMVTQFVFFQITSIIGYIKWRKEEL